MKTTYDLTADGTAGPQTVSGDVWVAAAGDFGSGTVSVQVDLGCGYVEVGSWDDDDELLLELPLGGAAVKFVLSGSGSPDIDLVINSESANG